MWLKFLQTIIIGSNIEIESLFIYNVYTCASFRQKFAFKAMIRIGQPDVPIVVKYILQNSKVRPFCFV